MFGMKSFLISSLCIVILSLSFGSPLLARQQKARSGGSEIQKVKPQPKEYTEAELNKLHREARLKIQ